MQQENVVSRIMSGSLPPVDRDGLAFPTKMSTFKEARSWKNRLRLLLQWSYKRPFPSTVIESIPCYRKGRPASESTRRAGIVYCGKIMTIEDTAPTGLRLISFAANGPSPQSRAATGGNVAEALLTTDNKVRRALESYFKKPIRKVEKILGQKKSDVRVLFEDHTQALIQNKNGTDSAYHIDRRELTRFSICQDLAVREFIGGRCRLAGYAAPSGIGTPITNELAWQVIESAFFGEDESWAPQYFTHTVISPDRKEVTDLSIIKAADMMRLFRENAGGVTLGKNTIHLNKYVSLQRRGGNKSDPNPDHIQTKLIAVRELFGRYQKLMLQSS